MAYPKENEHKAYLDYVEEEQSAGREALSKEDWRKQQKAKQPKQASADMDEDTFDKLSDKEKAQLRGDAG